MTDRAPAPAARCAVLRRDRANSPKAPSTWSHDSYSSARSAISSIGSKSPALTSPAFATTIAGAGSSRTRLRSSASRSRRQRVPRELCTWSVPIPKSARDFTALGRTYPLLEKTGIWGRLGQPASLARAPRRSDTSPARREADEVRHRSPGHQIPAELRRELEQVAKPLSRQMLSSRLRERGANPGAERSGRSSR